MPAGFYIVFVYVFTLPQVFLFQFKSINQCDFAVKIITVINTYS